MKIFVRQARKTDLEDLYSLTKQFVLLNLPADKVKLQEILETSELSFKGKLLKEESEFLFVAEDLEKNRVVAASKIVAKHGTKEDPHLFFKIEKIEKFSKDLGIGFIHQSLNFKEDYDGPTELGGLIVDRDYRGRPEKIGKMISLVRFAFIAENPDLFEKKLHCEFAPPLTKEGKSEFWEALGRRFTGLAYDDADRLSHTNKEFIKSLFPEDHIYMTLLESKARVVVGEVGPQTKPAKALMTKLGFTYKNEIDPFDGGPHFGALQSEVGPFKTFNSLKVSFDQAKGEELQMKMISGRVGKEFRAFVSEVTSNKDMLFLNKEFAKKVGFIEGQVVHTIDFNY